MYAMWVALLLGLTIYYEPPQEYLERMYECGKGHIGYDEDENKYTMTVHALWYKSLPENGYIFFFMAAYHGFLLWRYMGYGPLDHDAFDSHGFSYQFLCLIVMLIFSSVWIPRRLDLDKYVTEVFLETMVPGIVWGWLVTFVIPVVLRKISRSNPYPKELTRNESVESLKNLLNKSSSIA